MQAEGPKRIEQRDIDRRKTYKEQKEGLVDEDDDFDDGDVEVVYVRD